MRRTGTSRLLKVTRKGLHRSFFLLATSLSFLIVLTIFLFEPEIRVRAAGESVGAVLRGRPQLLKRAAHRVTSLPVRSTDDLWQTSESRQEQTAGVDPVAEGESGNPARTQLLTLNELAQKKLLRLAPMEFTKAASQTRVVMTLPLPNGTLSRFQVEESPVMNASLAAHFPDTKTYRGRGLDDPTATARFGITPAGFHAIVLSAAGTTIIEPAANGQRNQYVSYDQREAPQGAGSFSCVLLGAEQAGVQSKLLPRTNANLGAPTITTLRTYRLALAATAEFTQTYGGGTVSGALSAITTLTNAVNAIYERDLSIRLVLVANEASIIFTNAATDGYTSNDVTPMLGQNQVVLDQRIGAANYDLGMVMDGHVFNFQPGKFIFQGAAQFQSTCSNGQKGKAATILRSTQPSSISAIWVVAHELAHLLGALHTFNSTLDDCGPSRFAQVAYEPGSGSTILGYRGGILPDGTYYPLCFGDDLRSTDTYFHTASIEQITNYTTLGVGGACAALTDTGNSPPIVDAGADYTIPANTPFALTASANDVDGDALSYCWEQFDLGAPGPPHTDNGNRPIFRSFAPVASPTRTFPQMSDILSGNSTFGESLPTTNRTMNFRVTVRDNHAGGGGIGTAAMRVSVVATSGPFAVTQPAASTSWQAGSNQTVTWNVANTASAPINCANVRVLLSIDGGLSFPYTLIPSTPNIGSASIVLPNTPTSSARIKVEAIDNIFFNISLPNFTITPSSTLPPTLLTEGNTNRAIALDSVMLVRDPFSLTHPVGFSLDQRTRVMILALGLQLLPGEEISVVTAQAEDSAHTIYPLTVEYVGKVSSFDWFTQLNLRLPDGLPAGDVLVSVSLRGAMSNKVIVEIR